MKILFGAAVTALAVGLSACGSGGNVRSAGDYNAPSAPKLTHPAYSPYAAYGDERDSWRPDVADREELLVRPCDPATEYDRPAYESAPWTVGSTGALAAAPPGTF
jgi:hypothetical protein